MYSFQKEYDLTAHSPLIHFQYDSSGATLRATEVKPKLDRYILKHCKDIPKEWIRDDVNGKVSLDYKLRIIATESNKPFDIGRGTPYDIYYGNMGDNAQIKKGVMNNAKLTVTCFHEDLRGYIDKIIGDFFIVTNFGTMQSKGFGSFTVDGKTNNICDVLKKEYTNNGHCYTFSTDLQNAFKQIKAVYSLMKSGLNLTRDGQYPQRYHRSFLFEYARKMRVRGRIADMGDEKAWMKQRKISPALNRSGRYVEQHDTYSRYVRALLGIGETIEYQDDGPKVKVTIKETSKTVERSDSPILFKFIGNTVYFVGRKPNKEIYGKTFSFSSKMGKGELKVPEENELPENFMNGFMEYSYQELLNCKRNFRDIKDIVLRRV